MQSSIALSLAGPKFWLNFSRKILTFNDPKNIALENTKGWFWLFPFIYCRYRLPI